MRIILLIGLIAQFTIGCGGSDGASLGIDEELPYCTPPALNAPDQGLPAKRVYANDESSENLFLTPTELVPQTERPAIEDDLNFVDMETALTRQLQRFDQLVPWTSVRLGKTKYNLSHVKRSHRRFLELAKGYRRCIENSKMNCLEQFQAIFNSEFELYRPKLEPADPRYGEVDPTLFTAYYTPTIRGSKTQSGEFPYPVYRKPGSNYQKQYSRIEIDFDGVLNRKNLELFYTDDLFGLYLLHVEGGGHVRLDNPSSKSEFYLSYDGTNSKKWNFISRYMLEQGMISNQSIDAQRTYLTNHPERQREIYSTCPSYVFFKKSNTQPLGSDAVALTNNRSIATDDEYYKFKGLLAFVTTHRPDMPSDDVKCKQIPFKSFSRFYLDQDTGGAIVGKNRVDLYFGEGRYAELAAHNLTQRGQLYFAILKAAAHK